MLSINRSRHQSEIEKRVKFIINLYLQCVVDKYLFSGTVSFHGIELSDWNVTGVDILNHVLDGLSINGVDLSK